MPNNGKTKGEIKEFKEEYKGLIKIVDGELVLGDRMLVEEDSLSTKDKLYQDWLTELGIGKGESQGAVNTLSNLVSVGDYVDYIPDGTQESYTIEGIFVGYLEDGEEINQEISREDIDWRVLSIEGNIVTLISEEPEHSIGLGGIAGYSGGAYEIDTVLNTLYGGTKGRAENLKIEHVNALMGASHPETFSDYDFNGNSIEFAYNTPISELSEYIYDADNYSTDRINYYTMNYSEENNPDAYKVLFKDATNTSFVSKYWLASPSVEVSLGAGAVHLGMFYIDSGILDAEDLETNLAGSMVASCATRPIVKLNSDFEVVDESAQGTKESPCKIK